MLAKNLDLNDEIAERISKAAMNFGLLKKRAWDNNRLSTKVKSLPAQLTGSHCSNNAYQVNFWLSPSVLVSI